MTGATASGLCRRALSFALLLMPSAVQAHEIPNDVTVRMIVHPSGSKLQMAVRVPLQSLRDVDFPVNGPGYLNLAAVRPLLADAAMLWIADFVSIREGNALLPHPAVVATRIALPSDRAFASWEEALAHFRSPLLPDDVSLIWNQAMMDVLFEYPIHSDTSRFSIHPALTRLGLRVVTALQFVPPRGAVRAFEFEGDPGLVYLDPHWHQAALRFVELGFRHILDGTDHLLFLLCLVIPFRRIRSLVAVVTAFTFAHSVTLIASAYQLAPDFLWFPPLIETLIAVSIVYMALENIAGAGSVARRWAVAFGFGLVHGFGFSFALRETLQFAGSHMLASLISFNLGVEIGQLLVLAVLVPVLDLVFRFVVAERMGVIILSALVAHTGWHWMVERGERLRQFRFPSPEITLPVLLRIGTGMIVLGLSGALVWYTIGWLRARAEDPAVTESSGSQPQLD